GEKPTEVLHHYTSLGGLLKIVSTKTILATDSRYFSDAAEMAHAVELIDIIINHEFTLGRLPRDEISVKLFTQFREWLNSHMRYGRGPYVACFTTQGNLLSQWRGYTPPAKGVSVGFDPSALCGIAESQQPGFRFGKCIYDRNEKLDILTPVIYA